MAKCYSKFQSIVDYLNITVLKTVVIQEHSQVIHKREKDHLIDSQLNKGHQQARKEYHQCRRQKLISCCCCLGKLRSFSLSQAFKSRDPSIKRVMKSLCL